ncbi:ATP-binding protein [Candidatus Woesearchaeota archaeon]|nr:ATP-binding protein [Candidatus Woesearchaeota archaeon]
MWIFNRTYDLSLIEWINIGLLKRRKDKAVEFIRENKHIDEVVAEITSKNKNYLEKVLREEVVKQFSEANRPVLEIILNSIDAKPEGVDDYQIHTKIRKRYISIQDQGDSMNLDQILTLLTIPFNTNKDRLKDIGRFGVGFLSSFSYCLKEPKSAKIVVNTDDGNEAYSVEFYATGDKVSDIRMKIRRGSQRKKGTLVTIQQSKVDENLHDYLKRHLSSMPSFRAKIFVDRNEINKSEHEWYSSDVDLDIFGRKLTQKVHIQENANGLQLNSQGILIRRFNNRDNLTIDFPPAIEPAEGRDELKIDDNYWRCVQGAFVALEKLISTKKLDNEYVEKILDLIPSMVSALDLHGLNDINNIDELCKVLAPGKKYVITKAEFEGMEDFFGERLAKESIVTTNDKCVHWKQKFGRVDKILEDYMMFVESFDTTSKFGFASHLPNLRWLKEGLQDCSLYIYTKKSPSYWDKLYQKINCVNLVKVENRGSAFYFSDGILSINVSLPRVTGDYDDMKVYSLMTDFLLEQGLMHAVKKESRSEDISHQLKCICSILAKAEDDARLYGGLLNATD